ncbi:MAG: hypothetical protein V4621_08275 [Pseudomonadota bacterium]
MKTPGQLFKVVSGIHTGSHAEVMEEHPSFCGFIRCWIDTDPPTDPRPVALLHESQLADIED